MPLDRGGWENLSVVDEKFDCAPKGALAHHLGLFEQWPHLRLVCLLHGGEVLVQA